MQEIIKIILLKGILKKVQKILPRNNVIFKKKMLIEETIELILRK